MYMNLLFIIFALITSLLAILFDGLYIRRKRISGVRIYLFKRLFFILMFLSMLSLSIGVILTVLS